MRPRHLKNVVSRPKVSTMPRSENAASAYLNLYKVETEKKRLSQELEALEERRDRILSRIETLNEQVSQLEGGAQGKHEPNKQIATRKTPPHSQTVQSNSFDTLFLEY
jgi:chromosome segregation ATPase